MFNWHGYHRFWEPEETLSVLEIIKTGTIDLRLAGLLWLLMEHRASAVVSAGPSFAGKTTMLHVLLDFLPPSVKPVHLQGNLEDFSFLEDARPAETYLVASEFNNYFWYVWGRVARRAFQLMTQGYSLGGTIHARNAKEVAYIFYRYLGLPLEVIGQLGVIVNLRVTAGRNYYSEPLRQVESVSLPMLTGDSITIKPIALGKPGSHGYEIADNQTLREALSTKFGINNIDPEHELFVREQFLGQLLSEGRLSQSEVRQAIVKFYESRHG